MIKRFGMVLLAVLSAAAARAVSIDWTAAELATSGSYSGSYSVKHIDSGSSVNRPSGTIRAAFTFSGTAASGVLLCYGENRGTLSSSNTGNSGVRLYFKDGKLTAELKRNTADSSVTSYKTVSGTNPVIKQGKNEIAIAINRSGSTHSSSIFINGVECFKLENVQQSGFQWEHVMVGAPLNENDSLTALEGASVTDVSVSYADASIRNTQNYYKEIMPEPSALALLALGVSALALRRRAA